MVMKRLSSKLHTLVGILLVVAQVGCAPNGLARPAGPTPSAHSATAHIGHTPAFFIENRGQLDPSVAYYLLGRSANIFLQPDRTTLVWPADATAGRTAATSLAIAFADPNPAPGIDGRDRTPTRVSYFTGPASSWTTDLATYSAVRYSDLWTGIDLTYASRVGHLKYTLVVHPGADPATIRLVYRGALAVSVDEAGQLVTRTAAGTLTEAAPVVYQERANARQAVSARYVVTALAEGGGAVVTFALGAFDPTLDLVIDPAVFVDAGFFGGVNADSAHDVALDASGNLYLDGTTTSLENTFPVLTGPDLTANGNEDAYVAKFDPTGTTLIYASFLGGSGMDQGLGLAADASGNAYIGGETRSTQTTFPLVNAFDAVYNGGANDGFVAKLNPLGTALVYSTYLGGSGNELVSALALDGSANVYVTGYTTSTEATFPVANGPDLTQNGTGGLATGDAFVGKLNPSGSALVYSGFVGGAGDEMGFGIAVDAQGRAYVTGRTNSTEATFPETVGPDLTYNGGTTGDGFVARVAANGLSLEYAGYIGGAGDDDGDQVAVDSSGQAYVVGITTSSESTFPETVGPDLTYAGNTDAFVAKLNVTGSAWLYAGYLGGTGHEGWATVAVDAAGQAYVGGVTASTQATFPVLNGPDLTHNGGDDGFVARVAANGTALLDAGFIGGSGNDSVYDAVLDSNGNLVVAGQTDSTEGTFPDGDGFGALPGWDHIQNGSTDAFLARIAFTDSTVDPTATPTVTPSRTPTGQPTVTVTTSATAQPSTRYLFIPASIKTHCGGFFNDQFEREPNNNGSAANGPLCTGLAYGGYANDTYDVFSIDAQAGTLSITVQDHVGQGVQVILYYSQLDAAHEVVKDSQGPVYALTLTAQTGRYYLSIFTASGFNTTTPYRLTIERP